jgi:hypothetical protein
VPAALNQQHLTFVQQKVIDAHVKREKAAVYQVCWGCGWVWVWLCVWRE